MTATLPQGTPQHVRRSRVRTRIKTGDLPAKEPTVAQASPPPPPPPQEPVQEPAPTGEPTPELATAATAPEPAPKPRKRKPRKAKKATAAEAAPAPAAGASDSLTAGLTGLDHEALVMLTRAAVGAAQGGATLFDAIHEARVLVAAADAVGLGAQDKA